MIKGTISTPFLNGQSGTLYRYVYVKSPVTVPVVKKSKNKSLSTRLPRLLAVLCLALSVSGFSLLAAPFLTPYINSRDNTYKEEVVVRKDPEPSIKNFLISIEKIGLMDAKIIREVDIANKDEYKKALKEGLVHAQGSAYPDENDMIYIAGHSTNYPWFVKDINALFYKLETVENGDKVKIEYNGRPYDYYIFDKQIVKPREVEKVKAMAGKDVLILQTCYPPGTYWERLLVFARPNQMDKLTGEK